MAQHKQDKSTNIKAIVITVNTDWNKISKRYNIICYYVVYSQLVTAD